MGPAEVEEVVGSGSGGAVVAVLVVLIAANSGGTVTGGDTLTLEPVITRTQRRETLASRQDFTTGSWMVSVAYEGTTWKRVPCEGWC